MEKMVGDLKKIFKFKDTTEVGDIVLIAAKNPQMLAYALVRDIVRDETKQDEWWHVTLHILTVPPQKTVWILRTSQMSGMEIFTMSGEQRFVKAIDFNETELSKQKSSAKKKRDKPLLKLVKKEPEVR